MSTINSISTKYLIELQVNGEKIIIEVIVKSTPKKAQDNH